MQQTAAGTLVDHIRREIAKFVAITRRRSEGDLYLGRRSTRRHYRTWPLLISPLDGANEGDVSVALYNASDSGVAFRTVRAFRREQLIAVKLFWHDPRGYRVPAVVRHCEKTDHGFIVGCEFVLSDPELAARACDLRTRWYDA